MDGRPDPSSVILTVAAEPSTCTTMSQRRAPLWRITLVTPSRIVHASTESTASAGVPSARTEG
jgi:hypothetical protein